MDSGICVKKCPEPKTKTADLKDLAYGGLELLDQIDFTFYNPLGTYKSNKFAPLRLCMPDPDDLADTHPAQVEGVKLLLDKMKEGDVGKYFYDLYLSSTSIFYSMATSFFWSIVCIYFLSFFAEYVAWAMVIVI